MSETDTTNSVYEETITKETSHDEGNRILHHQSTSGTQGKRRDKRIQDDTNDAKIRGLVENLEAPGCCLILHNKHTGSYMTVLETNSP